MDTKDKALLIAVIGIVSSVHLLIIGELILSHVDGMELNTEILTIVKMTITGLLGIAAGRLSADKGAGKK